MHLYFSLIALFIFRLHSLVVQALSLTIPSGPIISGATVAVGWTATTSDPLTFSLALLCNSQITLQDAVDRGIPTNATGQVLYGTLCLGTHIVQALPSSASGAVPFAMSQDFQVVPANSVTVPLPSSATPAVPSNSASPSSVVSPSQSPGSAQSNHTVIILGAILGVAGLLLLVLVVLVVLLYVRNRRAPATSAHSYASSTAATEQEPMMSNLARELQMAQAEIARLRTRMEGSGGVSSTLVSQGPPPYRKQRRD
ncbi:hypothetical protein C8R47DRAFT_797940 [Mycena vitilis]|nr:hypothetical protein C8R47DRAFT_797940 [Mycena vitilis]